MNTHRLTDWEEDDFSFGLLVLASHMEDYQLAFTMNNVFGTRFMNERDVLISKNKKTTSQFSFFHSKESVLTPEAYLIDNLSVQNNDPQQTVGLFQSSSFIQARLLPSLKKWHYLLISEDCGWLKALETQRANDFILYHQHIDYKLLRKKELNTLTSIFHDK